MNHTLSFSHLEYPWKNKRNIVSWCREFVCVVRKVVQCKNRERHLTSDLLIQLMAPKPSLKLIVDALRNLEFVLRLHANVTITEISILGHRDYCCFNFHPLLPERHSR
jgi:hypothetical protein